MSVCTGAANQGALTQLVATGAQDMFLTRCPSVTFFRSRYNKHTHFSLEVIEQTFTGQVSYGADLQVTINRTGDLVYSQFVIIDLPGITCCDANACGSNTAAQSNFPFCSPCDPCGDGPPPDPMCPRIISSMFEDDDVDCEDIDGPYAHYINAVGQYLVKRACVVIGGQVIDTLWSEFLFAWEELTGKCGKRLTEMIGKSNSRARLVHDSKYDRRLYVPLPFWYTLDSGNALPLVSMQFHSFCLHICVGDLRGAIQRSDPDCTVVKTRDCMPVTNNDLNMRIETTFVYLDCEERTKFAGGCFEQLITQHQMMAVTSKNQSSVTMHVNFNHPVRALIWMARRRCNEICGNWFNFSGKWGRDPIRSVCLLLNNSNRFSTREGRYFRLVQPYCHWPNIPDSFVYSYSFALRPSDSEPTGSCNFSRIDNVVFNVDIQPALENEEITIFLFAINNQMVKLSNGTFGAMYSS